MEINVKTLEKLGFKGQWVPGEGWVGENEKGISIIYPHNRVDLPNGDNVFVKSYEQLLKTTKGIF